MKLDTAPNPINVPIGYFPMKKGVLRKSLLGGSVGVEADTIPK